MGRILAAACARIALIGLAWRSERMFNRLKAFGLIAITALTVAILWTAANATSGPHDGPQGSAGPTPTATAAAVLPPEPLARTYVDQVLPPAETPWPTGGKIQSRIWVAGGSWWAVMIEPKSLAYHIYQLVAGGRSWRDTGTLVDTRTRSDPDCLWDGTHLYVVSSSPSKTAAGAARLTRYSLDAKAQRFVLDADFPISLTSASVDSLSIARDSTGILWVSYITAAGQVTIDHSVNSDLLWVKPYALPLPEGQVTPGDAVAIASFDKTRIGVMWGNQANGTFYLAGHEDGDPDASWSGPETAITGHGLASDQLRVVTTLDGRLYALVKTGLGADPTSNGRSPAILLLERTPDGTWTNVLFSRLQDQHTSPLIAVDGSTGIVYAMATSPKGGGSIVLKRSWSVDAAFAPGTGSAVVSDPAVPATGLGSTGKAPVGPATGLVILAFDSATSRYVHGVIDLGAGVAAGTLPATGGPAPGPQLVFADDFNPWPAGLAPSLGWTLRPSDPVKSFTIAKEPGAPNDGFARIAASTAGQDVGVCKNFAPATGGTVTIDVKVRLVRAGGSDGVITEVRGSASDAASVRFGHNGKFAYYQGSIKIPTLVPFRLGAWYRSIVVVHVGTRRYDWRLLDAGGHSLLVVAGIPWKSAAKDASVDRLCLRTPTGGPSSILDWDNARVID
jgi:hypothetical protein